MILQWFYPPRCVLCGKLIKIGQQDILCNNCQNTVQWKEGAVCQKCGRSIYTNENIVKDVKKQILYLKKE